LFVGVSLDSETLMASNEAHYNPLAIEEWKQWLQNIGIYGPGGVTLYGKGPSDLGAIDNPLRASGRNNWGNFELNPLSSNSTFSYIAIETLWNDGAKVSDPNNLIDLDDYCGI
jgi:hypothetical protein